VNVIVPVAIAADFIGVLFAGVLFEPAPEQAASTTAVKINGTRVRRFIFYPLCDVCDGNGDMSG
jgi:hypothetical protein